MLPYGAEFWQAIRSAHAVLVPNLTDEQPRIVYDAYSQAVPVIASDTAGLRDCVRNGVTGTLVEAGDADALARAITWASRNREGLRGMGMSALQWARGLTHREMHRRRGDVLKAVLAASEQVDR